MGVWDSMKESAKRAAETTRFQYGDKIVQQVILTPREIGQSKRQMRSLAGVMADVETAGAIETQRTITRNVLLAGKSKKVDRRELYLLVSGPDFNWSFEVGPDKGAEARQFAAKVNTAAKQFALQGAAAEPIDGLEPQPALPDANASAVITNGGPPPPPTSVPAGWYNDPQGAPVLRYFDGQAWTEHTTALPVPPK